MKTPVFKFVGNQNFLLLCYPYIYLHKQSCGVRHLHSLTWYLKFRNMHFNVLKWIIIIAFCSKECMFGLHHNRIYIIYRWILQERKFSEKRNFLITALNTINAFTKYKSLVIFFYHLEKKKKCLKNKNFLKKCFFQGQGIRFLNLKFILRQLGHLVS